MAARGEQAFERKKMVACGLIGLGIYKLLVTLTLPALWAEALKHAFLVWWPLLLIAVGVLWIVAHQRARARADWRLNRD